MNFDEIHNLKDLQNLVNISDQRNDNSDWQMLDGVLRGSTALEISHHGGELNKILERLSAECHKIKK